MSLSNMFVFTSRHALSAICINIVTKSNDDDDDDNICQKRTPSIDQNYFFFYYCIHCICYIQIKVKNKK